MGLHQLKSSQTQLQQVVGRTPAFQPAEKWETLCLQPNVHSVSKGTGLLESTLSTPNHVPAMYNLAGTRLYVDPDLLSEVQDKAQESAESCGATRVEIWSKKNNATHVLCESRALPKYIGLNLHLVSFASEQHPLGLMDGYLACSGSGAHLVKGWAIFLNRSIFLTPEVFVTNKKQMKSYGLKDKPNQIKKGLTQELKAINPGERVIFVGTTSKP
ncbi:unnamed protein product [Sphagnum jensenii]|uniref:Uncharacterized protein n=1 Tax=Sphagnum jensenii TaxID=128206 RepID=A0ABP1BIR6_9BRYO